MNKLLIIWLLCSSSFAYAGIIHVGTAFGVRSLKQAIQLAKEGDSIYLHKGVYKEGSLVLTKSISIIGIDQPVLDGEGKYEILKVSGQNITIRGIHFTNAGYSSLYDFAALKVIDAQHVIVENNTVTNAYFAIHFDNSSYCVIRNNAIKSKYTTEQSSGNGIHLWKCDKMVVKGNHIQQHRDGIYFEFVTNSVIQNNVSVQNIRYGLHFMFSNNDVYVNNTFRDNGAGVAVMYSKKVEMYKNHYEHNWGASAYGILLKEISDSYIIQNVFDENSSAIHMEGTSRIEVSKNIFRNNGWALRIQASCNDNTIQWNNFTGNTFDVATNGNSVLNHFHHNFWDKYEGYDLNKDGIGDVPYHPISMYSMVIEHNPNAVLLLRSFIVSLLDRAEKAIPSLTPETFLDEKPLMKPYRP